MPTQSTRPVWIDHRGNLGRHCHLQNSCKRTLSPTPRARSDRSQQFAEHARREFRSRGDYQQHRPALQTSTAAWIMRLSPAWHDTVTAGAPIFALA